MYIFIGKDMCSQMEFQRKVLGEAKFPVYILQGANDLGQVEIRSLFLVIVFHLSYLCFVCDHVANVLVRRNHGHGNCGTTVRHVVGEAYPLQPYPCDDECLFCWYVAFDLVLVPFFTPHLLICSILFHRWRHTSRTYSSRILS